LKSNKEIAQIFDQMASLMELRHDDAFKVRSYRQAAELIGDLQTPLAEMAAAGGAAELRKLPGIGDTLSKRIIDIIETGTTEYFEELRGQIPLSVLELLSIDGIGMKTVELLFNQFQIKSLDDFAKFVAGGGLKSVPRLGPKSEARMKEMLEARGYKMK